MKAVVREGGRHDSVFIRCLAGDVFSTLGNYERILPSWVDAPGVVTLIAEVDARPVGFALVGTRRSGVLPWATLTAELLAIAVSPDSQGRGVGRLLLERAESVACERRARQFRLNTAEGNVVARRLFESAGFAVIRTLERFYPAGQRGLEMVKPLNPDSPARGEQR